jgi:hypothetical protein
LAIVLENISKHLAIHQLPNLSRTLGTIRLL